MMAQIRRWEIKQRTLGQAQVRIKLNANGMKFYREQIRANAGRTVTVVCGDGFEPRTARAYFVWVRDYQRRVFKVKVPRDGTLILGDYDHLYFSPEGDAPVTSTDKTSTRRRPGRTDR